MATRRRRTSRWSIALAEAVLLQALCAPAGHAADAAAAADALDDGTTFGPSSGGEGDDAGELYLDVTLNGAGSGLAHFGYRDGALWATTASLRRLGFVLPAGSPNPLKLESLPGVHARYDEASQNVAIEAPLSLLNVPTTVLNSNSRPLPKVTTSTGALLNYDLYGIAGEHGAGGLNAFTEVRAFNALGVLSSTSLARVAGDTGGQDRFVRLDTAWSTSFPESLLTLRIGDTLTDSLSWSRATRIGGIQFGRNFNLQPYLITAPMPSFLGAATLPSDVELYINGVRQYQGSVPAGPFQLNTVPNINGAGSAQIVMTDALGRATTLNFSLYDTHQLLAKGLSDWSTELGVVRRDYGVSSFEYGHDPAASGTWRYGVTDRFTAEAHAEATSELSNAGGGGSWLLGQAGVVSGAAARSSYKGHDGSLLELGYDWRNDRFNFAVGGNRTFGDYRDVASLYEAPPPRITAHALSSYTTRSLGSFSVGYLHLRYRDQPATRFANASWFKSIGRRASLNVNLNQDLDRSEDRSVYVGFTITLDDRTSLNAGVSHDQDRSSAALDVSHPVASQGGFGWRADVRSGAGQNGGQAELDYLGRYGRVATGVSAFGDSRYAYADATGSVVLMGGRTFAARHIDDAFAVVSTDGIADVPVELENRPIGSTDSHGMLLVTPLNAYQDNRLSIDPMQLPADVRIDRVRTVAAPADRAGALVRFGITPVRAATIVLVDADGAALPLGTRVRVRGQDGEPALVGFDGIVYLDTLEEHGELDVEMQRGRCSVHVDYHKQAEGLPQIGPLTCRLEQP